MNTFTNFKNKFFSINNFYALIFFFLPFVSFVYGHKEQLGFNFFLDIFQIVLILLFSLITISFIFFKTKIRVFSSFYNLSVLFYLIFNFNNIKVFLYKIFPENLYFLISELSLFLIIILFTILIILIKKLKYTKIYLNRFILIYFLFYFISMSYHLVNKNFFNKDIFTEKVEKNLNIKKFKNDSQNIYYIISDAAINQNLFNKIFNSKLSISLINKLKSKDLIDISNSRSNFNNTHLSVTSILNLDHPVTDKSKRYSSLLDFFPYYLNNTKPKTIKIVEELDYNFYWQGNIWAKCSSHNSKYCLSDSSSINTDLYIAFFSKSFFYSVYSNLLKSFKKYTFDPNIIDKFIDRHKNLNLTKKSFFLIHQFMPHGPHVYNQNCERRFSLNEWGEFVKSDYYSKELEGYKNSYICNLKKLNKLIDYITLNDPKATIVLTADHGHPLQNLEQSAITNPTFRLSNISEEIDVRFSMFNFIKTDKKCLEETLKKKIKFDNINTTILALNCSIGINIEYKKNKSYWGFLPRDKNLFGYVIDLKDVSRIHLDLE